MISPEIREEMIRLRTEDRLSLKAISVKLKVSKASCSTLLRDIPLSAEERHQRYRESGSARRGMVKDWGEKSKHFREIVNDTNQKGRIAEAAVAFRLALLGVDFYKADSSHSKSDFIVDARGTLVRIQVKWANLGKKHGLPIAKLMCADGRKKVRRYRDGEFDILAVYSLYTDTVYIFTAKDVIHKAAVTVREGCAECWDKVINFCER